MSLHFIYISRSTRNIEAELELMENEVFLENEIVLNSSSCADHNYSIMQHQHDDNTCCSSTPVPRSRKWKQGTEEVFGLLQDVCSAVPSV